MGLAPADTSQATSSSGVLRGLVHAVERAGIARGLFLRAAQLDDVQLDAPETRVATSEIFRLCALALELTADPALGLHWAQRLNDGAFVPVSPLIAHSASLREGLALLAQFFGLLSDGAAYEVFELEERVALRCLPAATESQGVQRFCAEMVVGGFWRIVRSFRGDARPELVSFAYAAPAHHHEYTRFFGSAVGFEQPFTGLVFDRALLDAPSRQRDDDVREALQSIAERRLLRITQRTPYALRVRELLVREGFPHRTDMKSVARALDMSVRSLRRRLDGEGKAYNDVLHEACAIVARRLLRDERRTIQEIGFEMGFSEASAFHRAFKRWTGTTPTAFREAGRK